MLNKLAISGATTTMSCVTSCKDKEAIQPPENVPKTDEKQKDCGCPTKPQEPVKLINVMSGEDVYCSIE